MTVSRPKRKAVPMAERRVVVARQFGLCKCGCKEMVYAERGRGTHFDHEPALILRDIHIDGTDYLPPQHSVPHLDAYAHISHARRKTCGMGASTAGSDTGKRKKERKRDKPDKPKRKWGSRKMESRSSFPKKGARKMRGMK
jgi:hypothetical protein